MSCTPTLTSQAYRQLLMSVFSLFLLAFATAPAFANRPEPLPSKKKKANKKDKRVNSMISNMIRALKQKKARQKQIVQIKKKLQKSAKVIAGDNSFSKLAPIKLDMKSWRYRKAIRTYKRRWMRDVYYVYRKRSRYEHIIRPILKKYGVPKEFVLLAGAESGYRTRKLSISGAAGMWQFMPKTAGRMGLTKTNWVDERKHIVKETEIAARYLRKLFLEFKDWHFAVASYHTGERYFRWIMKYCPGETFWQMASHPVRCKLLPSTIAYVKNVFVLFYFERNRHVLTRRIKPDAPVNLAKIKTQGPVSLLSLAKATDMSLKELWLTNPELSSWATPPGQNYTLLIPPKHVKQIRSYLSKPKSWYRLKSVPVRQHFSWKRIARLYRIPVRTLRYFNRLWGRKMPSYVTHLMVPLPQTSNRWSGRRNRRALARLKREVRRYYYRYPHGRKRRPVIRLCYKVRAGDTFRSLARRLRLPLAHFKRVNSKIKTLRPGIWVRSRRRISCPRRKKRRRKRK
jgi:soluble lytic murein transglycosylase-like protein